MAREQVYLPQLTAEHTEIRAKGEEFHHLHRVRRFQVGDQIWVVNGAGLAAEAKILGLEPDAASLRILRFVPDMGESPQITTLALGLLKGDHFNQAVEKATELGATTIQPLITDHVVKRGLAVERLERIMVAAVKQCQRSRIPALEPASTFMQFKPPEGALVLFCHDTAEGGQIADLAGQISPAAEVVVCIGPEGGWSQSEIDFARRSGYTFTGLGPRRLRAETAAALALGFVTSLQGSASS
jgi:16S rRNA (uracil1498-N3)-methyltransferase